jgi:uncharacterized Fe-S cluster-containing protein
MYINRDKDIINILANKYKLNSNEVENILTHAMKSIKNYMASDEMPNILLHNWGRFKPNLFALEKRFKLLYLSLEKDPEKIKEIDKKRYFNYIQVYERLLVEEKEEEGIYYKLIKNLLNEQESS